jgi:hypothetical protein
MAHDEHHHAGFHRAYNSIVSSLIHHTLLPQMLTLPDRETCALWNLTADSGATDSISHSYRGLSKTSAGLDASMTVTCKFSKKVEFVPGKETWPAIE